MEMFSSSFIDNSILINRLIRLIRSGEYEPLPVTWYHIKGYSLKLPNGYTLICETTTRTNLNGLSFNEWINLIKKIYIINDLTPDRVVDIVYLTTNMSFREVGKEAYELGSYGDDFMYEAIEFMEEYL